MSAVIPREQRKNSIGNSTLILLAFGSAFFSRVLDSAGAPSAVNFLHFATVPLACWYAISKTRTRNQRQLVIAWEIIFGLLLLTATILTSAIWNNAGVSNVLLSFLLLGEPFLLLLSLISIPMKPLKFEKFRTWLIRIGFANLIIAFGQFILFVILGRHPKPGNPDYIQGAFYHSGGGHVVSASVSLTFGCYYFLTEKSRPLWLRSIVLLATFWHMLISDAKQVLLVFLIAGVLLFLTKLKNIGEFLKYLVGGIVIGLVLLWCIQNVPAFGAFNTWARPEIYGSDGEATLLKSASLRIIYSYFESPINWLVGLGPGHTVGRLGGWMIPGYYDLLNFLGVTIHPVSSAVWSAVGASWLGDQSSMFSPFWGWAGIWGDLGFFGLSAYLFLASIIWRRICLDDFSRYLLLNVFVNGLIFTQMEEPGYMLFIAIIVALQWQAHQARRNKFQEMQ
jgi:hypothetical protein